MPDMQLAVKLEQLPLPEGVEFFQRDGQFVFENSDGPAVSVMRTIDDEVFHYTVKLKDYETTEDAIAAINTGARLLSLYTKDIIKQVIAIQNDGKQYMVDPINGVVHAL